MHQRLEEERNGMQEKAQVPTMYYYDPTFAGTNGTESERARARERERQ
jgi:hypothetical protein